MDQSLNILVVDDEPNIRRMLSIQLETAGHHVVAVGNQRDAASEASRRSFDLAFVDLRLGATSGLDLISNLMSESPWLKIAMITAFATVDSAVEAMKRGAAEYLPKPFSPAQVYAIVSRVQELRALQRQVAELKDHLGKTVPTADLNTTSPAMQRVLAVARQVAPSTATVLIRGENGTGKGVLARAIHGWSDRSAHPFTVISAPSLSAELLESELFGHAKGAFTGAVRDHPGRIAASEGGTLFLDEIGDLPLPLQSKLLRFLQDRQYERVGESTSRDADIRLVAATNIDLEAAVQNGKFRQDLLYRLNVIQIEIPPLRQRTDDVIVLARGLLAQLAIENRRSVVGFTSEAEIVLRGYQWPGNVRELRNVIERAVILSRKELIGIEDLPPNLISVEDVAEPGSLLTLEQLEEVHIRRVLAATKTLEEAALALGVDSATLYRKRKKFGI